MSRRLKWWWCGLVLFSLPSIASAQSFVGRKVGGGTYNAKVNVPTSIQNGNLIIAAVYSWGGQAQPSESGWNNFDGSHNSESDYAAMFSRIWHTGDPTTFTFFNANYIKGLVRAYNGTTGIDQHRCAPTDDSGSASIPALNVAASETYVGFWLNDSVAITGPSDFNNGTADWVQWFSYDGDKSVSAGTVAAETATAAGGDWIACGVTLSAPTSPTATPTPSGLLPTGVSNPQSGSWVMSIDDEFNHDSSINTSLWNGGPGASVSPGYYPMCWPSGSPSAVNPYGSCGYYGGNIVDDCLGYAGLDSGGQECGQLYTAQNGAGNTLNSSGLAVQDYNNYSGGGSYFTNEWTGLQNYGVMKMGPGSFVEWKAQLPHDNSGEGDGLHTDLWCTTNSRTLLSSHAAGAGQLDIAEHVMGTSNGNHTSQLASIFDGTADSGENLLNPGQNYYYSAPGNPDLTAGMHTYGMWWMTGGGTYGQIQYYVDGSAIFSPVNINDSGWGSGVYCFGGWMQGYYSSSGSWDGGNGAAISSSTSATGDPLQVQYFRYWKQN